MKKGYFITIEGPDGGGKTTQCELLAAYLRECGREVLCTREPGGTKTAEKIRSLVLDPQLPITAKTETLLYLAARAEHVEKIIKPALLEGKIILCDRFSDSTMVYQGHVRGLDLEALQQLDSFATGALEPDLTLLLDGAPELLAERRADRGVIDRFENEGLQFQQQVRKGFLVLAEQYQQRIKIINALRDAEAVQQDMRSSVDKLLQG